jgi:hypothetical protein
MIPSSAAAHGPLIFLQAHSIIEFTYTATHNISCTDPAPPHDNAEFTP